MKQHPIFKSNETTSNIMCAQIRAPTNAFETNSIKPLYKFSQRLINIEGPGVNLAPNETEVTAWIVWRNKGCWNKTTKGKQVTNGVNLERQKNCCIMKSDKEVFELKNIYKVHQLPTLNWNKLVQITWLCTEISFETSHTYYTWDTSSQEVYLLWKCHQRTWKTKEVHSLKYCWLWD